MFDGRVIIQSFGDDLNFTTSFEEKLFVQNFLFGFMSKINKQQNWFIIILSKKNETEEENEEEEEEKVNKKTERKLNFQNFFLSFIYYLLFF